MASAASHKSFSIQIRDGLLERVKQLDFFGTVKTFARTKMRVIQSENIPYLGCYIIDELLTPDGAANSGVPHFMHALKIGFSYVIANSDPDGVEDTLDEAHWALMDGLLTRQNYQHFAEGVDIEAFTRVMRKNVYSNTPINNETPVAEMQSEMTVTYRTYFPPVVEDDLERIHLETVYPDAKDDKNIHVKADWLFETEEKK